MRRHKLGIAGILLLTWATTAFVSAWNDPPFLPAIHTDKDLVIWNETCIFGDCALIFLKENVDEPIELLRLNSDVKPEFDGTISPILGLQIQQDEETPKYFLQATKPGSYENPAHGNFRERLKANGVVKSVNIYMDNVNDNEPVIKEPKDCEVLEGETGETNCEFTVTDDDGSACYIEMTTTDSNFKIKLVGEPQENCKDAKYKLFVDVELDFETYRIHSMTINGKDVGQVGPNTYLKPENVYDVSLAFLVTVNDRPDEPPKWTKMTPSIQVEELKNQIEQFVAIDGDIGLNWTIKYNIESEYEYFDMDENSGKLTIKEIDRDATQKDVYNLRVYAVEVPEEPWPEIKANISADIVVVVKDINNNCPEFEAHYDSIIRVNESTYFSEKLFTVIDPDLAENGTFSIDFEKNIYDSNFMIVPTTGYQNSTITVAVINASKLDYEDEDWREIVLKFVATESANAEHKGFANITIVLEDLNDESPIFERDEYSPEVDENQDMNALIETVLATDKDADDTVKYFMRNNSVSNILKIDPVTGEIRTRSKAFDYERQTELIVQVYALDEADHQGSCEVLISIKNINDEKPLLELPPETEETPEHSDVGTIVSKMISATDPDLELANLEFYINWTTSQAYKNGILVQSPEDYEDVLMLKDVETEGYVWMTYLMIKDQDRFDWEKFESLRVNIVVNDTKTHPGYTQNELQRGYVTVNVLDINDCMPIFTEDSDTVLDVAENNTNPRLVGSVRATDDDSAPNADIEYSISPRFPEGLEVNELQLDVDKKTGQLYTTRVPFDCEQFEEMEYEYIIFASDGVPDHNANITISVKVEDINDNAPTYYETIPEDVLHPKIYEEQVGPQEIVCLNAEDRDRTSPFNVTTYFLMEDEMKSYFEMKSNCLWAIDGKSLDREDKKFGEFRYITVNTRDNFEDGSRYNSNEGDKASIILTLLDINDNDPLLPPNSKLPSILEISTAKDKELFSIKVEDPDNGENGTIECTEMVVDVEYPRDRPDEKLFTMKTIEETKTCTIFTEKQVPWGDYIFHLNVSDKGDPKRSSFASYSQIIENYHSHYPVIIKPVPKTIFRLFRDTISEQTNPLLDVYNVPVEDFEVTDEDDPRTPNGQVSLKLIGGDDLFTIHQVSLNTFRLLKIGFPMADVTTLEMELQASDKHPEVPFPSEPVPITVYFKDENSVPQFRERTCKTNFTEEEEGLQEKREIDEAVNEEELLEGEERREIFYFIRKDDEYFQLYNKTRILSLRKKLDYEDKIEHTLEVVATHETTMPQDPPRTSVLTVIVDVVDINDMAPKFSQEDYFGVFRASDTPSNEPLTTVTAFDVDTDDTISYEIIPNTMGSESSSLEPLVDGKNFRVDISSGNIYLDFSPSERDVSGSIYFQVVAFDSAGNIPGHTDNATVNMHVVSDKHQVIFYFLEEVDDLHSKRNQICPALKSVLPHYECSIERIIKASVESANKGSHTDVYTHFIDGNTPVETPIIASEFLEGETYAKLTRAMLELNLTLVSFSAPTQPEEEGMAMTIVLAAVCAVLAVLVIVFSLAFFVRTRTLNQRLERLTMKKFGSQDSGLNRETLAVPGTNRHALEGSNPVWNHEIDPNFDAQSQISGDSDLIGIEDSPEFGGTSGEANPAFQRDVIHDYDDPPSYDISTRRTSLNPLAAHGEALNDPYGFSEPPSSGDMDVPRRFSINPLASGGIDINFDANEEEPNDEDVDNAFFNANNSNTFEPTTEL